MTWLARLKNQNTPNTHPTEPTKPGFVGFVGTPQGHIQKIGGDASAANDPPPDTEVSDPDRWCWPHSEAMTGREIDAFTVRLVNFTGRGVKQVNAESLAYKLVIRDREFDDRVACLECNHLSCFGHSDWYCENWQAAGVATRARDAHLPANLVMQLQRCIGFNRKVLQ